MALTPDSTVEEIAASVRKNLNELIEAATSYTKNIDFMRRLASAHDRALGHMPKECRANREIVLASVAKFGISMKDAAATLKKDEALGLIAVSVNGWSLEYLDPALKKINKLFPWQR